LVVATGLDTIIGGISRRIISIDSEIPLNKSIKILSNYVGIGVLVISAGVFGLGILYGNSFYSMFFTAVAVAVSLVPEGLPVVITLVLSLGAFRMAKQNALVKNLGAVEALGQASVIAVDKTGTITKNELMVEKVYIAGKTFSVSGSGYEPKGDVIENGVAIDPANHPEIIFAGKIATFCANARVMFREKEGIWKVSGDPTEAALLVFGEKVGFHKDELEQEEPQTGDLPFDSVLKYHAVVHTVKKRSFVSLVGAPESVLDISTNIWQNSRSKKLTEENKKEFESVVHSMSREGLRVLAFSTITNYEGELGVQPVKEATFVGLFAMRDVLREGVRESIETAKASGLRVVMITGDHKVTAEAIAREAGIFHEGDSIITGKDIHALSVEELLKQLPKVSVFARVTPEDKLDIIQFFKKNGDTIAMTGDGVNDALSLVAADLGIAMGRIGTEVSKEAADIVLLDDNFNSIVQAIEEGRNIYVGIKKVILYLFSTGLGELMAIVIAMLIFLPPPVFPTQILWLNLVTDGFLVVALAFEPKEKLQNGRITRKGNKFFFDRLAVIRTLLMGLTMGAITVFVFASLIKIDTAKAYTMALTVLAALQWWNAWNVRSETDSIWSSKIFKNPYLIVATFMVIILQLFAIYNPHLQAILKTTALSLKDLALVVLISLTIVLVEELRKFVYRSRDVKKYA
jgi:Ca2+-transporting ATPase